MTYTTFEKNPSKEVFAVKINGLYYGAVTGDEKIYLSEEGFDSPLKASNNARSLKKKYKIEAYIKKQQNLNKVAVAPKINRNVCLYTEAEMSRLTNLTDLRFREAWVIMGPTGQFVVDTIKPGLITEYVKEKNDAKIYLSYDEANLRLKTLDTVLKKGHRLQRFFIETKDLSRRNLL